MKEKPSNYVTIPAEVRFCKKLPVMARMLYGEIAALTNCKGYCWATNQYLADLYGVDKTSISRNIGELSKLGFLHIKMIYAQNSNQILERRIYLNASMMNKDISPPSNSKDKPSIKESNTRDSKNVEPPMGKNAKDNNLRFNNTSTNILSSLLQSVLDNITCAREAEEYKIKEPKTEMSRAETEIERTAEAKKEQKKEKPPIRTNTRQDASSQMKNASKYDYTTTMNRIKENIEYEEIIEQKYYPEEMVDNVCHVITTTICTNYKDDWVSMGSESVYAETVRSIFLKLTKDDIEYFLDCFNRLTTPVIKLAAYIRTSLFRNFQTYDHHIKNLFNTRYPHYSANKAGHMRA